MDIILINLFLLCSFSLLVMLSARNRRDAINMLIIFHSLNALKILFWCVWAMHKTGTLDFDYLQYVDERFYVNPVRAGAAASNMYHSFVIGLRSIGFGISSIKMLNVLLSSFAIVRLYTLKELVVDRRRYVTYVFLFCGLFYLRLVYFAIFALKDAIFFFVAVEFLVQLVQRPTRNRWYAIALSALVLMLIRPPMVFGFLVFVFDRNWRLRWGRVVLAALVVTGLAAHFNLLSKRVFYIRVANGLKENLQVEGKEAHGRRRISQAKEVVASRSAYLRHMGKNMARATMVFAQADMVNKGILFLEWCILFYLLVVRRNLRRLVEWWPILSIAFLYFVGGVMTLYNIRYHTFPVTFVLCLAVFVASRPLVAVLPRSHRPA